MGLKNGTVELHEYDKKWIKEFEQEKEILKNIFNDLAISIEHIGSTSIPELASKPIIDIAVGVKRLEDFEKIKNIFESNGEYLIKKEPSPGEYLVIKEKENNTTHLIHVMEHTSQRYIEAILFRDYLINHPDLQKKYQVLKEILSQKYKNDREIYTASKNEFIQMVLKKAHEKG